MAGIIYQAAAILCYLKLRRIKLKSSEFRVLSSEFKAAVAVFSSQLAVCSLQLQFAVAVSSLPAGRWVAVGSLAVSRRE